MIRRRKGGCAVVMGRLSPRTRNAQVELYQEREVDFLVATDAIGMGLNMDVDHVAFAGLGKFDGHRPRRLTAAEWRRSPAEPAAACATAPSAPPTECPPLPDDVVEAVEAHNFDPLDVLCWRNRTWISPASTAAGQPDRAAAARRPGEGQRRLGSGDAGGAGTRPGHPGAGERTAGGAAAVGSLPNPRFPQADR